MATELARPMADDPGFVAEIAKVEEELGPLSAGVIEARWQLRLQAQRCAAGDHVYTWAGQTVDLPGGSPHQIMVCAYAALHADGAPSPRLVGPLHTSENAAKRLWTGQELKESAPPLTPAPSSRPAART
jgi:hypothetical protein